jgi:hypothetical protein
MVYDLIRRLPPSLLTLAHRGGKVYSETFDLVHRREASKPNGIWQVDHCQLRISIPKGDGTDRRLQSSRLRVLSGVRSALFPAHITRSSAGIWRKEDPRWPVCGVPDVLYTDNGTDLTSRHLEQIAADLKISIQGYEPTLADAQVPSVESPRTPWKVENRPLGPTILPIWLFGNEIRGYLYIEVALAVPAEEFEHTIVTTLDFSQILVKSKIMGTFSGSNGFSASNCVLSSSAEVSPVQRHPPLVLVDPTAAHLRPPRVSVIFPSSLWYTLHPSDSGKELCAHQGATSPSWPKPASCSGHLSRLQRSD